MLRLLVDTSTWLDLAKRRDGQKWIVAIRLNVQWGNLQLLVPALVIDEFQRNRPRIESSMTASVAERFRQMRRDFDEYGGETHKEAIEAIDKLAHQVPLIGAMTTRNFDEILNLLHAGESIEPTDDQRNRVVQRGLDKKAPFHRQRNSVADALLIEMYASAVASADLQIDPHGFVTSNHDDFSVASGDRRLPHEDLAEHFAVDGSSYWLGVDGLDSALLDAFGDEYQELLDESDFREEPRRLDEIVDAESELFDRIGTTERCRMSTDSRTLATRQSVSGSPSSPAQPSGEWRNASAGQTTSGRTPTSSGACSAASSQRCDGCSVASGTSSIRSPGLQRERTVRRV